MPGCGLAKQAYFLARLCIFSRVSKDFLLYDLIWINDTGVELEFCMILVKKADLSQVHWNP